MKIVTIVGARPQFIKAAPVSRELQRHPEITQVLVHTGQHYDEMMSAVFFGQLGAPPPDYDLGVGSGSHGAQTARMLEGIERVLLQEHPDWVLVYGDTNSTLAGALAAVKLHLPVAHVEAGLRSFNRRMPEEINRVATDHMADLLLAPTNTAVINLQSEGIAEARILLVGDVMFDAALIYGARAERESRILDQHGLTRNEYILATVHRAENADDPDRLRTIVAALGEIATSTTVVWPLHPRTQATLAQIGRLQGVSALKLIDPVGYLDMLMLERHSRLIVTDSGGVQKEAFFFRTPCVTLREETEWTELVELGWNHLAPPTDGHLIGDTIRKALLSPPGKKATPFGSGNAAAAIVNALAGNGPDRAGRTTGKR